ncbi:MAG: ATP-binding protein [Lachnospiraceae bacterium]|nr:ATP-binding protein [Lachnospiraceae bacterium]
MALINAQYESIIREYEEKQTRNRHLLEKRLTEIRTAYPEYAALEDASASLSVSFTKRLIAGEEGARQALSASLKSLHQKKEEFLLEKGFPADYLEPVCECPDCQDTGYIGQKKCHCFERKIIELLYHQSNLSGTLAQENFDTLSYAYFSGPSLSDYKKVVDISKEFVSSFDKCSKNLLFMGTVGTGKTFLSNCIAKALIDTSHSVIYFSATELFDSFAGYVFGKDKNALENFCNDLYHCDLVIVDDLGTELESSFVTSYFFSFLNERQQLGKSTLITTNLDLKELNHKYSDRICSRIIGNFEICLLTGPDIRIRKKT